jgi:hypothetical protein
MAVPIPGKPRYFRDIEPTLYEFEERAMVVKFGAYHHCPYEPTTPIVALWQVRPKSVNVNVISLRVNGNVIANWAMLCMPNILLDHDVGLVCHVFDWGRSRTARRKS